MQKVILDLLPGGVAPIVYASQYDDGRSIRFMLTEGGPDSQYSLNAGDVITCNLTKPDGTETVINVANPGGGEHYVDLVNGADDYDQAGAYLGEIVLTRNARVIGSANFVLKVEEDAYGGQITTLTATGNPCTFTTDLADALVSLTAEIVASGGNGTPENPIPIVGYSELNLTRCGVNFTDISDNTIAGAGYVIGSAPQYINGEHFYLPSGKYTFSFDITNATYPNACQIIVYGHGIEVTRETKLGISQSGKITITFTANAEINQMLLYCNSSTGGSFSNFQMEVGSTAHSYEPYNGQTFTVAFGQTVYGGVYDKSGRLTITHKVKIYNGSENWITTATNDGTKYRPTLIDDMSDGVMPTDISEVLNVKCNMFEGKTVIQTFERVEGISWQPSGSWRIYTTDYDTNDISLWKTFLSNHNLQIAYELATPIVIDVQSISVFAENGVNNIVSDCLGDVSVQYIKKV